MRSYGPEVPFRAWLLPAAVGMPITIRIDGVIDSDDGSRSTVVEETVVAHMNDSVLVCSAGYYKREDEGVTWAKGWHTVEAEALRTAVLLSP